MRPIRIHTQPVRAASDRAVGPTSRAEPRPCFKIVREPRGKKDTAWPGSSGRSSTPVDPCPDHGPLDRPTEQGYLTRAAKTSPHRSLGVGWGHEGCQLVRLHQTGQAHVSPCPAELGRVRSFSKETLPCKQDADHHPCVLEPKNSRGRRSYQSKPDLFEIHVTICRSVAVV